MTASHERIVRQYLDRLEQALAGAPKNRRREISGEIEAHIREELAALGHEPRDHEVLQILERVGEPEAIAAETFEVSPEAQPTKPRSRAVEIWALIFLTVGGFVLPILGWIVGVILLWVSQTWNTRDKILGTFIPFALVGTFLQTFLVATETCMGGSLVEIKPGGRMKTVTEPFVCESSGLEPWMSSVIFVALALATIGLTFYLAWRVAHPRPV